MTSDGARLEVSRRFRAAPENVFAAFAESRRVARWLSPAPDIKLTVLHFDFRQDGAYRFEYRMPSGLTVIVGGYYRTIEPPWKIVFSWMIEPPDEHAGIESEVTVMIRPDGHGSELVIRHEKLVRADAAIRHTDGWRGALEQLAVALRAQEQSRAS